MSVVDVSLQIGDVELIYKWYRAGLRKRDGYRAVRLRQVGRILPFGLTTPASSGCKILVVWAAARVNRVARHTHLSAMIQVDGQAEVVGQASGSVNSSPS